MPLKEQKDLGNKGTRHSVNIVNIQAYLDVNFWDFSIINWSERSACAALRRCSETKCPLYL